MPVLPCCQGDLVNMQLRNKEDFWSGVMFLAIGVGFALGATSYSMGTSARMGPGYFPFWLGVLLALLGAIVALGAMSSKATETEVGKFDWKRSEEHTSELQSLMRISYAVFCLKKKNNTEQ